VYGSFGVRAQAKNYCINRKMGKPYMSRDTLNWAAMTGYFVRRIQRNDTDPSTATRCSRPEIRHPVFRRHKKAQKKK
jgi:hypothetical protein